MESTTKHHVMHGFRWLTTNQPTNQPTSDPTTNQPTCKANRPSRLSSSLSKVVINLVPVAPSGCPSAMAPPLTFNLARSAPSSFAHATGTEAKASLTSYKSMSSMASPVLARICLVA